MYLLRMTLQNDKAHELWIYVYNKCSWENVLMNFYKPDMNKQETGEIGVDKKKYRNLSAEKQGD